MLKLILYVKQRMSVNVPFLLCMFLLLSLWVILAVQFQLIPLICTNLDAGTSEALNAGLLNLSYSYIAALIFYVLTNVLSAKKRRNKLNGIIKQRILGIGRCIRDILLEFARDTQFKADIHDVDNTEAILKSKNWMITIPILQKYNKVNISYLRYMSIKGGRLNQRFRIL